jgi:AcrR family transcriptional regulator
VFRVVRRAGFEQASLRNVAEEAGLAIGSVRHYFDGHTDLMVFATAARTRPELRPLARESYDGMRTLVRRIVDGIARRRRLAGDPKVETERLCALIDGLTVEGVLHPGRMTPELMVQALRRHLQTLVEPRL